MPEQNHNTIVYKYAVKGDVPQEVIDEMRRGHNLWNTLVAIDREHSRAVADVWSDHPVVAAVEKRYEEADARVGELREQAKQERQRRRERRVSSETSQALREAQKLRRDTKAEMKDAQRAAYPTVEPRFVELRNARRNSIKSTYREFVDAGLYWANFNAVTDSHRRAGQAVKKQRSQGRPADVRFHRWDGSGTITVQLQRGKDDPARTPELLASGEGKWRNVVQLSPWCPPEDWRSMPRWQRGREARTGRLTVRIGSGEHARRVTLPVTVHRMLPPEADIAQVQVTRKRIAGHCKVSVSVTARLPQSPARVEGRAVATHVGWRALDDGALRVATVAGTPPRPPDDIVVDNVTHVVRDHGDWYEIVVPAAWRDVWAHQDVLQSERDLMLGALRDWLTNWLDNHTGVDLGVSVGDLRRWRSPQRFAGLALRLRDDAEVPVDVRQRLEAWRRQDKHLWEWQANERRKVIAQRTEAWRRVAAWLTAEAALVTLDAWDIDTRTPDVADEDDHQARAARSNRVLASPGQLRLLIAQAADRRGVRVERPDTAAPATHRACGRELDRAGRMAAVMVWCPTCEILVDQDVNAVNRLLRAVR